MNKENLLNQINSICGEGMVHCSVCTDKGCSQRDELDGGCYAGKVSPRHYVVYAEWCVDYEGGHEIIGVYHSKEEAVEVFKNRVNSDDRLLAEEYGYTIYEDSDICFDSGEDGEYVKDHIYVGIEEVS